MNGCIIAILCYLFSWFKGELLVINLVKIDDQ